MPEMKRLATVDEIPPGSMKSFDIRNTRILVCNIDGTYYALADECTHDSAPISTGHIHGDQIVCPRHGARFDVKDGAVKAPPAVVPIETYPVKIENNEIFVEID